MAVHPAVLVGEAIALVLAAPLLGVLVASRARVIAVVLLAAAGSCAAHLLMADAVAAAAADATLRAHALFAISGLVLAGLGRAAAAGCRHPLDAVAVALLLAIGVSAGLLASGQAGLWLPTPVVNAGLLVSPLVAVTSAGHVDLLRSGLLYDLSPLAHREFAYPSMPSAAALHGAVAVLLLAAPWRARPPRPTALPHSQHEV